MYPVGSDLRRPQHTSSLHPTKSRHLRECLGGHSVHRRGWATLRHTNHMSPRLPFLILTTRRSPTQERLRERPTRRNEFQLPSACGPEPTRCPSFCIHSRPQTSVLDRSQPGRRLLANILEAADADPRGDPPPVGALALLDRPERKSQDIVLLRQWLATFLKPYDYMTVSVVGEDGGRSILAFQLLDLERKNLIVRPFVDADDMADMSGLYSVKLQPLEVFRSSKALANYASVQTLDTFLLQEPCQADILGACGGTLQGRKDIVVWQARQSDIEGCVELHNRQSLLNRATDLMSPSVPVLSLLDALHGRGFVGTGNTVEHHEGVLAYDSRRITSKRNYLQCVVHSERLAQKGVGSFSSIGSAAFFAALLHSKRQVSPGLPARRYRQILAAEQGDELALANLADGEGEADNEALEAMPKQRALQDRPAQPPQLQARPADDNDDSSVVGGASQDERAPAPIVALAPDSGGEGSVVGAASDTEGAAAMVPAGAVVAGAAPAGVPDFILGVKVSFVGGRHTATHTYANRLSVRCSNPTHHGCQKSRSIALLRDQLGPRSAESFLGAWLAKADSMEKEQHAKYTPRRQDMERYLVEHP